MGYFCGGRFAFYCRFGQPWATRTRQSIFRSKSREVVHLICPAARAITRTSRRSAEARGKDRKDREAVEHKKNHGHTFLRRTLTPHGGGERSALCGAAGPERRDERRAVACADVPAGQYPHTHAGASLPCAQRAPLPCRAWCSPVRCAPFPFFLLPLTSPHRTSPPR